MSILQLSATQFGSLLAQIMNAEDILPGDVPSYQTCKAIFLAHPLGAKIASGPIKLAQSQERKIAVPTAPTEVKEAFIAEWNKLENTRTINNIHTQARAYGLCSVALVSEHTPTHDPIPPDELWKEQIGFNVIDPLNTSGLIIDQNPNSLTFQKHGDITVQGRRYHRSRTFTVMNEESIYLAWTSSAFSFAGRSCYQRILYPLKTYLETMRTDNLIVRKSGVLIAKLRQPGSIADQVMTRMAGLKRMLVKEAQTDGVLSVATDEAIETLNMQNLDSAYSVARDNTIKNIAVGAPLPAKMLTMEAFVLGFGEGTQDAAEIARFGDSVRNEVKPLYAYFDRLTQQRAWNPEWYEKEIQPKYPEIYRDMSYSDAFYTWRRNFDATWPNLIKEPESDLVKIDEVRLRAVIAIVQVLAPLVDPQNKSKLIEWCVDQFNSRELLFQGGRLIFNQHDISDFLEEEYERQKLLEVADPDSSTGPGGARKRSEAEQLHSAIPPRPFAGLGDSLDANEVVTDLVEILKTRGR